jgi:CelD/BcsL family acetyltransferase involved in cellulose biosynthesis
MPTQEPVLGAVDGSASAKWGGALRVLKLSGPEALSGLVAEWELLDKQSYPRTPFTSPDWIILWWKHFRRNNLLFHDEFFCHCIRDATGRLAAIAPLMRTCCPGFGVPAMRMLQFFGTDPNLTELRGVICRPEDHVKVINALTDHFLRHRDEWDVFRWNGLRDAVAEYKSTDTSVDFIARYELADYVIDLPRSWDELKGRVSSNMRKNIRKAYEFLERDGLQYELRVAEAPGPAIDRFLSLHTARSQAEGMIDHPDRFATARARTFLADYLWQLAARGHLRVFELAIGGNVVASRLTFLLDSDLYTYFAGYDPAWKQYSVMTVLMSEIIKWAIGNGVRRVNLSTGTDQSKLRWKPAEMVFRDAVQISPTLRGRGGFRVFRVYETLSRTRGKLGV